MSDQINFHLVIISGVSGSGKSLALNALEDCGYFCVDNLPAPLFPSFVDFFKGIVREKNDELVGHYRRAALLVDCRERNLFEPIKQAVIELKNVGVKVTLIYLDCDDEVILRRFKTTRRPHPLLLDDDEQKSTIQDALAEERKLLTDFRMAAEHVIDTTSFSPHHLRATIEGYIFESVGHAPVLEVTLLSFGFKYGLPAEADLVIDVRFLPNPHFVPELNQQTGLDDPVKDFIFKSSQTEEFLSKFIEFIGFLLPRYREEGKRYLTLAIGCTGGKHRSVALVEYLSTRLKSLNIESACYHRDIERGV